MYTAYSVIRYTKREGGNEQRPSEDWKETIMKYINLLAPEFGI